MLRGKLTHIQLCSDLDRLEHELAEMLVALPLRFVMFMLAKNSILSPISNLKQPLQRTPFVNPLYLFLWNLSVENRKIN